MLLEPEPLVVNVLMVKPVKPLDAVLSLSSSLHHESFDIGIRSKLDSKAFAGLDTGRHCAQWYLHGLILWRW